MEYIHHAPGSDENVTKNCLFDMLAERTDNNIAFSEYEAAVIIKKLLQTIDFCHSHKIMHKDIKPK